MSGFYFSSWLGQRSLTKNNKLFATVVGAFVCSLSSFFSIGAWATQPLTLPEDIFEKDRARYLEVEKKLLTYSKRSVQRLDNDILKAAFSFSDICLAPRYRLYHDVFFFRFNTRNGRESFVSPSLPDSPVHIPSLLICFISARGFIHQTGQ